MITVLIDGAGTVTCQSVIKGLKAQKEFDVRIITMDMKSESVGAYWSDVFYKIPSTKDDTFIITVLDIMKNEKVDLFIPIIDYGFEKLAFHKQAMEDYLDTKAKIVISSLKTIKICNDKLKFHDEMIDISGIKTCGLINSVKPYSFPFFVKPRFDGRASLDCYKVTNDNDMKYVQSCVDNPLFLEYLDGIEHTVDTLSDFNGKWIGGVSRVRTETKSGVSYKAKVIHDNEMLNQAKIIVEYIGIIGPSNIQCFKNDKGIFWFEINPRFAGTLVASLSAGFNSPHMLLKLHANKKITDSDIQYEDITMLRYWDEIILDTNGNVKWISQI